MDDPTGVHFSLFAAANELTVVSNFSTTSYVSFMDPSVSQKNVRVDAQATAVFHPVGYITYASNQQDVMLVRGQDEEEASFSVDADTSGFDMYMASVRASLVFFCWY